MFKIMTVEIKTADKPETHNNCKTNPFVSTKSMFSTIAYSCIKHNAVPTPQLQWRVQDNIALFIVVPLLTTAYSRLFILKIIVIII